MKYYTINGAFRDLRKRIQDARNFGFGRHIMQSFTICSINAPMDDETSNSLNWDSQNVELGTGILESFEYQRPLANIDGDPKTLNIPTVGVGNGLVVSAFSSNGLVHVVLSIPKIQVSTDLFNLFVGGRGLINSLAAEANLNPGHININATVIFDSAW